MGCELSHDQRQLQWQIQLGHELIPHDLKMLVERDRYPSTNGMVVCCVSSSTMALIQRDKLNLHRFALKFDSDVGPR